MLFNSYEFLLIFLPLVLCVWWFPRLDVRWRLAILTASSYLFYGWWDYRFVPLLWLSTWGDYVAGNQINRSQVPWRRRGWLLFSMTLNLGLLAFFKYLGFFAESWNALAQWQQWGGPFPVPKLVLPVGISFYTFQTMSYTIDIYRGAARPARSLLHFAAYVSMFPQLIAGPIVRYSDIEDQMRAIPCRCDWNVMARGIMFFVLGMCQKVLLADTIAAVCDPLWRDPARLQLLSAWFAALGYTCQLYFDFAGYSNMAVGLGLMLGFSFPQNFDSPYQAANIAEFWRRWHMTLSFWLRDYLFIPLGGSRAGSLLTARNLFIVMFLGGLWHGAGWTFVCWGLYHGLLLAIHAALRRTKTLEGMSRPVGTMITFISVVVGWVLFRSPSLSAAGTMITAMAGCRGIDKNLEQAVCGVWGIAVLGILLGVCLRMPNMWRISVGLNFYSAAAFGALMAFCVLRFSQLSPFLYFQF